MTNQYSLFGLVFENPSYPGQATAQTDLTYGVPDATGNILWVRQGGAIVDPPAEPFRLLFSSGVNMVGFNYASSADAYLFVEVYNNDQLVESAVYIGSATPIGWGGFAGLQLPASFNRLDLSYHPISDPTRTLNFSVDNVQFQGTPEPSSLILGLLGLSGIAWRRFRLRE